jgi:dephospho-CoA kinase
MKIIFVINGSGESGKDTFIKYMSEYFNVLNIDSVYKIKEAATVLDWDGQKDERSRSFLSDLKHLSVKFNDCPYKYVSEKLREFYEGNYDVAFIHIREADEIRRIVQDYDAKTILVRSKKGIISSNPSDGGVENYTYDYILRNYGSLNDLKEKAKGFAKHLKNINRYGG